MSQFTYLVTVDTEREEGLHASRDEQSEKIMEALEQGAQDADISGIGGRSDSAYSVTEIDIQEMEKKELKAVNAEYDRRIAEEAPPESKLKAELRVARQDLAAKDREIARLERKLAAEREKAGNEPTRIWIGGGWDDDEKTFLPDGRHDHVYFRYGDHDTARFTVGFDGREKSLEIRTDDAFGLIAALPISGNVLRIAMVARD